MSAIDTSSLHGHPTLAPKADRFGRLKIFFGAVPHHGSTLAMLERGRERLSEGIDVVRGIRDLQGQPEIQNLLCLFEKLPSRSTVLSDDSDEFDVDGALKRKPDLILLDAPGHVNIEGTRHRKRWKDIEELLRAGIDIYATLDVLHLESLKDIVGQITGLIAKDSVPDAFFEKADEIELIDISTADWGSQPQGKRSSLTASTAEKGEMFSPGILLALRELALRKGAEWIDDRMRRYRSEQGVTNIWPATERLLVCVGPNPRSDRLIRAARRMATGLRIPWIALNVEAPAPISPSPDDLLRLEEHMRLAESLGAETVTLQGRRAGETILDFARARNVSRILVGKPTHPRWKDRLFGSLLDEVVRGSEGIEVYVITGDATEAEVSQTPPADGKNLPRPKKAWLLAVLSVFGSFAAAKLMAPYFAMADLVMVFLVGIVLVATRWGMGPSLLATLLSIACFDFFFVPPFHTFAVSDPAYLVTFGVMFLVANVISRLTARVREQAEAARLREQRTAALYGLSRDLVHERSLAEVAVVVCRHIGESLSCKVRILVPATGGTLASLVDPEWQSNKEDEKTAEWVLHQRKPAGRGTHTHTQAKGLFFPLVATSGPVGVLGLWREDTSAGFSPEQLHLLEGLTGQAAQAMERVILAEEAQRALLSAERETLRSTLLSSVSHDLRTPLAAITGAGTTLLQGDRRLDEDGRQELLQTIVEEAAHLNRIIRNVLDMTRLESGAIQVNREWQSLEEIVGAVTNRMSGQFSNHPLAIKLPPDLPLIPCDGLLIEQVLRNLLENAVKYTPLGTAVTLSATANEQEVTVTVTDRGSGIPAAEMERIFEKFVRGKHASGGVGLGLATRTPYS